MKVFQAIQKHLASSGVVPDSTEEYLINKEIVINSLILILTTTSANKILWSEASNFREYADSFYATITVTVSTINFIATVWKRQQIFRFITNLESIIARRIENPASKAIYEECNQQMEKYSSLFILLVTQLTVPSFMLPTFVTSYFNYFSTKSKIDSFQMPYPMWWPMDWRDPETYFLTFCIQYVCGFITAYVGACNVAYISSSIFMLIFLAKDIKESLYKFNDCVKDNTSRSELSKQFNEILELHTDAKQLVKSFSESCHSIITCLFLWSFGTISGIVLLIQMEGSEDSKNFVTLMTLFGEIFWSFVFIFLFCEFGERVRNGFEEINDSLIDIDWYLFPSEIQRMIPTALIFFQAPVVIPIVGNFACSRYVFDKLVNRAFSCSMIIRQFGNYC